MASPNLYPAIPPQIPVRDPNQIRDDTERARAAIERQLGTLTGRTQRTALGQEYPTAMSHGREYMVDDQFRSLETARRWNPELRGGDWEDLPVPENSGYDAINKEVLATPKNPYGPAPWPKGSTVGDMLWRKSVIDAYHRPNVDTSDLEAAQQLKQGYDAVIDDIHNLNPKNITTIAKLKQELAQMGNDDPARPNLLNAWNGIDPAVRDRFNKFVGDLDNLGRRGANLSHLSEGSANDPGGKTLLPGLAKTVVGTLGLALPGFGALGGAETAAAGVGETVDAISNAIAKGYNINNLVTNIRGARNEMEQGIIRRVDGLAPITNLPENYRELARNYQTDLSNEATSRGEGANKVTGVGIGPLDSPRQLSTPVEVGKELDLSPAEKWITPAGPATRLALETAKGYETPTATAAPAAAPSPTPSDTEALKSEVSDPLKALGTEAKFLANLPSTLTTPSAPAQPSPAPETDVYHGVPGGKHLYPFAPLAKGVQQVGKAIEQAGGAMEPPAATAAATPQPSPTPAPAAMGPALTPSAWDMIRGAGDILGPAPPFTIRINRAPVPAPTGRVKTSEESGSPFGPLSANPEVGAPLGAGDQALSTYDQYDRLPPGSSFTWVHDGRRYFKPHA